LTICRALRREMSYTPILILTSRSSELDRVLGLEQGADDYVTKPFSVSELVARAKAIFRRIESVEKRFPGSAEFLNVGDVSIDTSGREVRKGEDDLALTAREFDLLLHFARHPGQVFSRTQLLDSVWGYGYEGYEHTVNSHINRLRAKIEKDPAHPQLIVTCWGIGYKFDAMPTPSTRAVSPSVTGASNVTQMRHHQ
ncbi:MAG: response regulator transcription factor, partial [Lysobacterales bacterium]